MRSALSAIASPSFDSSRPRLLADSARHAGPQKASCALRTARSTSAGVASATSAHGLPRVGSTLSNCAPPSASTGWPPMKSSYASRVAAIVLARLRDRAAADADGLLDNGHVLVHDAVDRLLAPSPERVER